MKKAYVLFYILYFAHDISAMDHYNQIINLVRQAVSRSMQSDNSHAVSNLLRIIYKKMKLQLSKDVFPLMFTNPLDYTQPVSFYLGHWAIRTRDFDLFTAYLDHLELEDFNIPDDTNKTLLQTIAEEMKTKQDYGILEAMLFALNRKNRSQIIWIPQSIPPLKTIRGFEIKSQPPQPELNQSYDYDSQ